MSRGERRAARRATRELHALIEANARLWAGEAEVFAAYFGSPLRSPAADAVWLERQCFKELVDGVVGRIGRLSSAESSFERTTAAALAVLADEVVRVELKHFVAFGIALRESQRAAGTRARATTRVGADWPENTELQTLRESQRREFGELGERASAFTEGGYCTLYRAGMALKRETELDDAIATACAQVFDDEWEHMLEGIAGLAEAPLQASDWTRLEELTLAQGRCRIRMRNAQFGAPLGAARVRELLAGAAQPLDFDYARAGLLPPRDEP